MVAVIAFVLTPAASPLRKNAHGEIKEIIEAFRLFIIEKDEGEFHSLFRDKSVLL
ncbi:hypothetical protein GL2_37410 [Microbulbifer sp. GL-2]|nr:hypothetical protein GL2_37410 [Microbulbifer sp. GL-2]